MLDIPNKYSGQYNFIVDPGSFKITYSGIGYVSQTIDTTILQDNPVLAVTIDVNLVKDPNYLQEHAPIVIEPPQPIYEKINLAAIPEYRKVDTSMLILNMKVNDVSDKNIKMLISFIIQFRLWLSTNLLM